MFNYIGKLLGKAVYEGIVLDVHFAQFFLRHLASSSSNNFYSYIDDLPAFDPELAKNLAYVKRCEDVSDLGLTFEWTEDVLGQVQCIEVMQIKYTFARQQIKSVDLFNLKTPLLVTSRRS